MIKATISILKSIIQKKFVRNTGIYTLFRIVDRAIPFLILPIISRQLSKESLGTYLLFMAVYNLMVPLVSVNIDASISVNYFQLEKKNFGVYFTSAIFLYLVVAIAILLIISISNTVLSTLLELPGSVLILSVVIIIFRQLNVLRLVLWQIQKKASFYGVFQIHLTLLKTLLGLSLVFLGFDWLGLLYGLLLGNLLLSIYSLTTFWREGLFKYVSIAYAKDALRIGSPLILHKFGAWSANTANRIIISKIKGKSATASFGIASTFNAGITIIQDAFNKAFVPFLFEELSQENPNRSKIVKITYYYYIFINLVALLIAMMGYWGIGLIFGDIYAESREYIFPLVYAGSFNGMYKLQVNFLFYTKNTQDIFKITLLTGIMNLIISYFLVKKVGIAGAAWAMLLTQMITYLLVFYIANRRYPMPWFGASRE